MSTFADWNNEFRIVEGVERAIVPTGLIVTTAAHQLPNGQISTDAEPGIIIDEIDTRDGYRRERLHISGPAARALAVTLIEAADELDRWGDADA